MLMLLALVEAVAEQAPPSLERTLLESGPLGALVLTLGAVLRYWIADVKSAIEAVGKRLDGLAGEIGEVRKKSLELELEVRDLARRTKHLESVANTNPIDLRAGESKS